ncbi:MAG: peptidoglycan-binding domain-containing protein [Candidatus Sulfotelmatobacter sp.]
MFLASKIVCAGIVFVLLTTGISGTRPMPLVSADVSKELPTIPHPSDVNKMQQILQDKGHYRSKVDGVLGLRTRAGIRAYQKAENVPVTGQLDRETARRLGVDPEEEKTIFENPGGKSSAGITWFEGSKRAGRTLRKPVSKWSRTVPAA